MTLFSAVAVSSRTLAIRSPWTWAGATPGATPGAMPGATPGAGPQQGRPDNHYRLPDLIWPRLQSSGETPMQGTPTSRLRPKRGVQRLASSAPRGTSLHPSRSSRSRQSNGKRHPRAWRIASLVLTAGRPRGPERQTRRRSRRPKPRSRRRPNRRDATRRPTRPGMRRRHRHRHRHPGMFALPR